MRKAVAMVVLLIGVAFVVQGAADKSANPGLDKLKSLAGKWEGKNPEGKPARVSYKVVSSGTAVLETLNPPEESEMVTLYTADGDRVALTHYCPTDNQPRMRSAAVTAPVKELAFTFTGATNLASPDAGHMHKLVLNFDDASHFSQHWTWREKGVEKTEVFRFTRKN